MMTVNVSDSLPDWPDEFDAVRAYVTSMPPPEPAFEEVNVDESTWKTGAFTPPSVTPVASLKPEPVSTTGCPTAACAGLIPEIAGGSVVNSGSQVPTTLPLATRQRACAKPVFGTVASLVIVGEALGPLQAAGGAIVVLAAGLAARHSSS